MYKINVAIFAVLFLAIVSKTKSQSTDCSQTLLKAQDTYKEGRINEVADMIQPCLESGLNKQEKIEAWRLLTLTYLYFNETEKAQEAMTHLLKNDPEYKIRHADPTEFVNLYNSFRTTPIVIVGAKFGTNFTDVDVMKNFSLDNSAVARGEYKTKAGIQGGLIAEFPIKRSKISLLTEVLYSIKSYSYKDTLFSYSTVELPQQQAYIEVPLLINYNFGKGRWNPYFNLGGSFAYLLSAKATPLRVDKTGSNNQRELKEPPFSINSLRTTLNYNLIASAGIKIKDVIGRGYIFFNIRYSYGLNNVVNAKNRYSNPVLMYNFLYIDNNYKLNSFQYSIGYSYPLYKPKLKKVKIKDPLENQ